MLINVSGHEANRTQIYKFRETQMNLILVELDLL